MFSLLNSTAQADIFGSDDRRNPITGSPEAKLAESVAVGVLNSLLTKKENGNYDVYVDPMSDLVCHNERFSTETSIAYGCTGFLVGPDLLMTAGHCSVNRGEVFNEPELFCKAYTWMFDYKAHSDFSNISAEKILKCKEIIYAVSDDQRDFALIRLDRKVTDRDHLKIAKSDVTVGDSVSMYGSPLGMPTKFTNNAKVLENIPTKNAFTTNLDAFEGNSGSPVLNDKNEVVGILISGSPSDGTYSDPVAKCGRYNYCDDNGENCVISKNDSLDGSFQNGSDVEKLLKYKDLIEQYIF
jgi:V8-like Glu-specific endopeptidase